MPAMEGKRAPAIPYLRPFKQAVTESGLAYTSMRDAAFRGEIPVVRIGRAWYLDMRDLTDFIASHKERLSA